MPDKTLNIVIREVRTASDLRQFVRFPYYLFDKNPYFVPPLRQEEMDYWNLEKNPELKKIIFRQYLAEIKGKVVGRIACLYNPEEKNNPNTEDKIRFTCLDFENIPGVAAALLRKVENFAREYSIRKIEGPMGITNMEKAGMLTYGFEEKATMIGLYNPPYYPDTLEAMGYVKDKKWVEFEIEFPTVLPEKVYRFSNILREKYGLRQLKFMSKKDIQPWIDSIFDLLDITYQSLSTYTPLSSLQKKIYRDKYFPLINKDYIICIVNGEGRLVAFAISMPSYSEALQKAGGRLYPFGWYSILNAERYTDRANFYLIGVHPEYQRRGITALIFEAMYNIFKTKGIRYMETNPELEENHSIQALWSDYEPRLHKRRATFSKILN